MDNTGRKLSAAKKREGVVISNLSGATKWSKLDLL